MFEAPHGAVCAALLPHGLAVNLRTCRERLPGILHRFTEIAQVLTGSPDATAEDGLAWVHELCNYLHVPPLRNYGIAQAHLPDIAARAAQASSMKANPLPLTPDEIFEVVSAAW
jgi:alcohol dehydrogenase class IV